MPDERPEHQVESSCSMCHLVTVQYSTVLRGDYFHRSHYSILHSESIDRYLVCMNTELMKEQTSDNSSSVHVQ